VAPYFYGTTIERFDTDIHGTCINALRQDRNIANQSGMKLVTYEGGQSDWENCVNSNSDARIVQTYKDYLSLVIPVLDGGVYINTCSAETRSAGWCWGDKQYYGEPETNVGALKYRAYHEWITENPSLVTYPAPVGVRARFAPGANRLLRPLKIIPGLTGTAGAGMRLADCSGRIVPASAIRDAHRTGAHSFTGMLIAVP
jgi:hypothetical protein